MKNFYKKIRNFKLPTKNELQKAISLLSKKEFYIFISLFLLLIISTLGILQNINNSFMVEIPAKGGSFSEGIIGNPRFINPVLALSDADQDIASLVYSGLMRKDANNKLIPDLAKEYEISKDGLSYTFILKDDIYFQDGKPVTTEDIIFTINQIKDPVIKSPKKGNWDGVSIEKIDENTIKFNLQQPYASFLENSTIGILPAHIWNNSKIELNEANINPIGSGPYLVSKIDKESSGKINYYEFKSFNKFILGTPFIKKITLRFYPNEEDLVKALKKKEIDQASSISPNNAEVLEKEGYRIESPVLPRVFGIFFNQNQAQIFTNKNIISAINKAINKDKIINEVLKTYGVAIDDPIPPNMINYKKLDTNTTSDYSKNLKEASLILEKDGWTKDENGFLEKTTTVNKKKVITKLEFSMSTGNAPELAQSAELIRKDLESIGIKVDVKTFEIGNLNQSVIRPRKYDALLFGQIINHESDLFAFWHSSQRKDPGLNVAMYTNAKVDKILEDAFITVDETSRIKKYAQFESEIKKDIPGVFLYSPNFIYVVSKDIKGIEINHINTPSNRFLNSYLWYKHTENIWKIFSKN